MWWGKKCKMLFIIDIFPIWTHSLKTQPCFLIFGKVLLNLRSLIDLNCQLDSELFWWWWCSWWLHLLSLGLGCRGATSLQITRNKSLWPLPWICALLSKEHLKLTKMTSPRYPAAAAHEHLRLLHLPLTPAPEHSLLCCHRFLCV